MLKLTHDMKRLFYIIIAAFALVLTAGAQIEIKKLTFGYLDYEKVLQSMADYANTQVAMQGLREQYDKEAVYNEEKFFKMYSDYIQGQKTFPEDIMLKRQKELQVAMDQGIKFREESEKLLRDAEEELLKPIEEKLDSAIALVAKDRGLAFVLNRKKHNYPFINAADGIDITELVNMVLAGLPLPKQEPENVVATGAEAVVNEN